MSGSDDDFVPDPNEYVSPKKKKEPVEVKVKEVQFITLSDFDTIVEVESEFTKWEEFHKPKLTIEEINEKYPYTPSQMEKFIRFQQSDNYIPTLKSHAATVKANKLQKGRNEYLLANKEYNELIEKSKDASLNEMDKMKLTQEISTIQTRLQTEFLMKRQLEARLNSQNFHKKVVEKHKIKEKEFIERVRKRESEMEVRKQMEKQKRWNEEMKRRKNKKRRKKRKRKNLLEDEEEEEEKDEFEPPEKKRKLNLKRSKLDNVLENLKGDRQVSTLQHTRNIWEKVKVDEEFKEDVENRTKDYFLEKKDFLDRIERKGDKMSKEMRKKERQFREMQKRADKRRKNR